MNVRLEIQLANKPGALVRVLGLAERRGFAPFRVQAAPFGPTTQMVHLTVSDDRPVEQLVRQIQKLYDVRHVERRR
ncbi:MAG: ACT domain-containing protein [Myxococcota bacterium]|nr:ACT domain-containing protein [Myxococcota bacterium]